MGSPAKANGADKAGGGEAGSQSESTSALSATLGLGGEGQESGETEARYVVDASIKELYTIERLLSEGSYGIVWKGVRKETGEVVAIKKVFEAFYSSTDAQRTYREVMFLTQLRRHTNIIKLHGVHPAVNNRDLYLVFEYMESDLHSVIRAQILQNVHKQYIVYQTLRALKYIHSGKLLHRDLKPCNLLVSSTCELKVCDFGLSRSLATTSEDLPTSADLTVYVATRWYRAPEILLGCPKYTVGIDLWSLGCIIGELLVGKPLFPGSSTLNQLERIFNLIGRPSDEDLASIESPFAAAMMQRITAEKTVSFAEQFPSASLEGVDLMLRLLQFNPAKRISVRDALRHPFVRMFHNSATEPVLKHPIRIPVNDDVKHSKDFYRSALYQGMEQLSAFVAGDADTGDAAVGSRPGDSLSSTSVQPSGSSSSVQSSSEAGSSSSSSRCVAARRVSDAGIVSVPSSSLTPPRHGLRAPVSTPTGDPGEDVRVLDATSSSPESCPRSKSKSKYKAKAKTKAKAKGKGKAGKAKAKAKAKADADSDGEAKTGRQQRASTEHSGTLERKRSKSKAKAKARAKAKAKAKTKTKTKTKAKSKAKDKEQALPDAAPALGSAESSGSSFGSGF
ncbi:CMGC/MAPK/ERK7 protein kinase [Thecamonas trahens ATCC 50062]|uniref:CMGC/MAPK/ERK7 protein kinase n=1 Tax=Thecamonas trahens ATCC 50062 TaxID=461836 RepID=A0A0L0DFL9_THETB|nr:CMGC/MAPK/ERK7 protein kinase [Thecamonas trahens ATCC 50062]KNC51084.1 CMGC/MAPK/ERK7 protein kinase [Thecamonas trahens ATCC 50062]|eukprot:XP_013756540.1 CMGC/MAPK/ERK7 protein kinase [Thecamonas trahens ATCC 50062]